MSCTLPVVRGGSSPSGPGSRWEGEIPSQPRPGESGCPQRVPTAPGWVPAHPVPAPLHPLELLPVGPEPEGLGPPQGPFYLSWGCHCQGTNLLCSTQEALRAPMLGQAALGTSRESQHLPLSGCTGPHDASTALLPRGISPGADPDLLPGVS